MKVLVVDLDNTLFNTQARFNACLAETGATSLNELKGEARRAFWECYQSPRYMDFDVPNPNVVDTVRRAKDKGWIVVLLTGRNGETQREKTLEQLAKYNVPYDYLIMRNPDDFRKETEYKKEILNSLKALGDVVLIDDNPEVRKLVLRAYSPEQEVPLDEARDHEEFDIVMFTKYPPVVVKGVSHAEQEVYDLE